jgi:hypothetical protein
LLWVNPGVEAGLLLIGIQAADGGIARGFRKLRVAFSETGLN